jgi:hypothetical protein
MKGKKEPILQGDLFKTRLSSILNLQHELCLLADEINWSTLINQLFILPIEFCNENLNG